MRAFGPVLLMALLVVCGGPGGGSVRGATNAGAANVDPSSAAVPPGGIGPGSNFGSAKLQIAVGDGLFFIDRPTAGDPSIAGLVMISDARATPLGPAPGDTVVTLNGVELVRAVIGGNASDRFFTVDAAGPQPTIAPDGFVHITASSASVGASRTLNLPCSANVFVTSTPAPGASLAGLSTLALRWSAPLPDASPNAVSPFPTVSLFGFDLATGAIAELIDSQPVNQGALEAGLVVRPTNASGYLAEVRYPYPGIFFLDGNTGGYCGRTTRIVFAN